MPYNEAFMQLIYSQCIDLRRGIGCWDTDLRDYLLGDGM